MGCSLYVLSFGMFSKPPTARIAECRDCSRSQDAAIVEIQFCRAASLLRAILAASFSGVGGKCRCASFFSFPSKTGKRDGQGKQCCSIVRTSAVVAWVTHQVIFVLIVVFNCKLILFCFPITLLMP